MAGISPYNSEHGTTDDLQLLSEIHISRRCFHSRSALSHHGCYFSSLGSFTTGVCQSAAGDCLIRGCTFQIVTASFNAGRGAIFQRFNAVIGVTQRCFARFLSLLAISGCTLGNRAALAQSVNYRLHAAIHICPLQSSRV
jgi:hypothetical protein